MILATEERLPRTADHHRLPPIAEDSEDDYMANPILSFQQFIDSDNGDEKLEDGVPSNDSNSGSDSDVGNLDKDGTELESDKDGTESDNDIDIVDGGIKYGNGQAQSWTSTVRPRSVPPRRRPEPKPSRRK
jgi:hypothetical protein